MRVSLRPDPRKGVFETLLVLDGQPTELAAHLERLAASLHDLYRAKLPAGTKAAVREAAAPLRCGRLRLTLSPTAAGLDSELTTAEIEPAAVFPGPERGLALRSVVVEQGLGAHKWADRRLLEQAEAKLGAGELPLLVDGERNVLEASRGSLFAVVSGALRTPPVDGRILPGIARAGVVEVGREIGAGTREAPLTLEQASAGEAFLAGSVRGVEPVVSLDGVELGPPGELSARIAAGLRRRWAPAREAAPAAAAAGERPAGQPAR